MSVFIYMIYVGGACAMPERKIGIWRRICWPETLGQYLHKLAIGAEK